MITLQVAALKRNLQLEEMRQFRQMSRPSFQLKPREIIDQDEENSSIVVYDAIIKHELIFCTGYNNNKCRIDLMHMSSASKIKE